MKRSNWNALRVRPYFEFVVAKHLKNRGIEQFLPLQKESGRSVESPLLPGYVFTKCDPKTEPSLMYIPGVLHAISGRGSQVNIYEREIEDLQQIVHAGCHLWPLFSAPGDRTVRIENGALRGVVGILQRAAGRRFLVLSVHLIRRSIAVELDADCIVTVAANQLPRVD